MTMKLNEIYINAARMLNDAGIENGSFEAKELIKHLFQLTETDFILKRHSDFCDELVGLLDKLIVRRITGEPLQYIIGEWDFMGRTYKVGEGVLIPRPETEQLCEAVADMLRSRCDTVIYDLCSGSGCIAVTLKLLLPGCDVYAVEKSPDAFSYLVKNNMLLCGENGVKTINDDIFNIESFANLPCADAIVSNPPYIRKADIASLQCEVLREPIMALDGGDDGLDFYRYIVSVWKSKLKSGGFFAFECGEDQSEDISEIFDKNGFDSTVVKDYNNINRIVIGRRKN